MKGITRNRCSYMIADRIATEGTENTELQDLTGKMAKNPKVTHMSKEFSIHSVISVSSVAKKSCYKYEN